MASVVVVFPKPEDARNIRSLLMRNGFQVSAVCTSGLQALEAIDHLNSGVVVCGYKFPDMLYDELLESLPPSFTMLLIASQRILEERVHENIACVGMPLKVVNLIESLNQLIEQQERIRRKKRMAPAKRNEADQKLIDEAKKQLMEKNNLSEMEAHRYLQKSSMDSGTNMVEAASMVLTLLGNSG